MYVAIVILALVVGILVVLFLICKRQEEFLRKRKDGQD